MIQLASLPRCGSTYLYRSLAGMPQGDTTPNNGEVGIWKTHRPPPPQPTGPSIFVFGDPVDAVVSTFENRYDRHHFANCGKDWPPEEHIFDADILGYEELVWSWLSAPYPVLCVRYEAMQHDWCRGLIEWWVARLGTEWLPWRPRLTRPSGGLRTRVGNTYNELAAYIASMPPLSVQGKAL